MNILIADDDPVSRTILAKIVGSQPDHKITLAVDGGIAWELLDDPGRSFDILFLDLEMPKISGFELLQRIRESPVLKSLQVVLCTSSNDRATVVKAVELGARHYLIKPAPKRASSANSSSCAASKNALHLDQLLTIYCLSLRRSLGDCGNPRSRQPIGTSWIATPSFLGLAMINILL